MQNYIVPEAGLINPDNAIAGQWNQYWTSNPGPIVDFHYEYKMGNGEDTVYHIQYQYKGSYGGENNEDMFYSSEDSIGIYEIEKVQELLGTARNYAREMIKSIPYRLPPVVKKFIFYDADWNGYPPYPDEELDPDFYAPLSLEPILTGDDIPEKLGIIIYENRTPIVKVSISVKETGEIIKDAGGLVWNKIPVPMDENNLTGLPYVKKLSVDWWREVESGLLPGGDYHLVISVIDEDANISPQVDADNDGETDCILGFTMFRTTTYTRTIKDIYKIAVYESTAPGEMTVHTCAVDNTNVTRDDILL